MASPKTPTRSPVLHIGCCPHQLLALLLCLESTSPSFSDCKILPSHPGPTEMLPSQGICPQTLAPADSLPLPDDPCLVPCLVCGLASSVSPHFCSPPLHTQPCSRRDRSKHLLRHCHKLLCAVLALGLCRWLIGKVSCQCRRLSSIPGSGRSPRGGNGNPLQ